MSKLLQLSIGKIRSEHKSELKTVLLGRMVKHLVEMGRDLDARNAWESSCDIALLNYVKTKSRYDVMQQAEVDHAVVQPVDVTEENADITKNLSNVTDHDDVRDDDDDTAKDDQDVKDGEKHQPFALMDDVIDLHPIDDGFFSSFDCCEEPMDTD